MSKKATPGRKQVLSIQQQQRIVCLSGKGNISLRGLAEMYGVSHMTIYRIVKRSSTPEQVAGENLNQREAASHDICPRIYSAYG